MAEMNKEFFEEAKYGLQHSKINYLNVATTVMITYSALNLVR